VILAACAWAETLTPAQYHELVGLDTAPKFSFKGKKLIGKIVKVYDGDTYHLVLNVNYKWQRFSVRAAGIDTPERRGNLKEFGN
jgi:endonuclease YncB( thermonuclease family)